MSDLPLKEGLPAGPRRRRFPVANLTAPPRGTWPDRTRIWTPLPPGFAVDSREDFYVSDPRHNQVYRLDSQGRIVYRFGRAAKQKPGHYDEHVFMTPTQLAVWTDTRGQDRLLILERGGPGRVSEWTPDGHLLRQWFLGPWSGDQGYAVDPEDPEHVYGVCASEAIPSFGLIRFRVNYDTGDWKVDAVWPDICSCIDPVHGGTFPGGCDRWKVINYKSRKYLAFARSTYNTFGFIVYRQDGDNWVPSAALLPVPRKDWPNRPLFWGAGFVEGYWWHDANGDGKLQEEEYRNNPTKLPGPTRYFGENWLDDLSLTWIQAGSPHIWRIAPSSFDQHGNPIFDGRGWQKLLTDPIYAARAQGKATALYGGNELADKFEWSWEFVDGSPGEGFYVCARGGKPFDANSAPQYKISRYVPDGKGGYVLKWRTGRAVYGRQLGALAEPGEIYGALIITRPVNGLLGVQDSWGGLYHIYTDDGLYVDTLFSDSFRYPLPKGGVYFLGGENFSGYHFLNKKNGKVYICMTANNPCCLFEVQGWTKQQNPVRRLTTLPRVVTLEAQQIASPPEHALRLRGGAGKAWLARFYPALGGPPPLDGSLEGWQTCTPVSFQASDQQTVEVRCLYDPEHLYLRWHARLGRRFEAKPLHPADRLFTHDRGADTLSFYLQGDPQAKPGIDRPGDVRLVFGIFEENGRLRPVCLGMYPKWSGPGKANPVTYGSAVTPAAFEHVALLEDVRLNYQLDADGQGFVLIAAVPRKVLPRLPPLHGGLRTFVNFEATFGGRNKFWWANADGSASIITLDEPAEARLYQGSWAPAQWVDVHNQAIRTWNVIGPFGFEELPKLRHLEDRPALWETLLRTTFPPETQVNLKARYQGPMTQTRQKQRSLTWQSYSTGASEFLDFQQALDWKQYPDEGTAYAVAYIYSPAAADIQLRLLHAGGAHALRVWLNDKLLPPVVQGVPFSPQWFPVTPAREKPVSGLTVQATAPQAVRLQAGWNQLLLRFDWIWGAQQVGVLIDGDERILWQLRLRTAPR